MPSTDLAYPLIGRADDGAPALLAPGRAPMTYGGLRRAIAETAAWLGRFAGKTPPRIAIVLPNGPEMAVAFLAVASHATAAPLNPAYREEEFDFFIGDLGAQALMVLAGDAGPARAVARRRGVPVVELAPDLAGPAGAFNVVGATSGPALRQLAAEDVALVLHTSGTTARPKIVPLTQANLRASAANVAREIALDPADLCLNVMPLFHIHGLVGVLLASMATGAGVVCTPGFNALKFFAWMDEFAPTWVSAVPTMLQAILARAERNRAILERRHPRLIRSSSAPLPPRVMAELESKFGCPVIESYGMTEAAHQMTSNPLPPSPRKPGTVGRAAGPDVAVLDDTGRVLPSGRIGEVAVRGANVMTGYENNPAANAAAFVEGWFRTGDQGAIDAEGYLTITGRLKEIINRGGEKISPREVDEALLDHPAVAEAVAFALAHDKLGEEVAAAVVLKPEAVAGEAELRAFLAERLADFKVPRKIVLVAEMPKGPTGKPQRLGMAKRLGLA
jgi:acyl-CoA synthetase (AMP-forming)/AMP-acid ligase II